MNALDEIDLMLHDAPTPVLDAWRIVRGHLRRRKAPSRADVALDEEPTKPGIRSATEHFQAAQNALKPSGE